MIRQWIPHQYRVQGLATSESSSLFSTQFEYEECTKQSSAYERIIRQTLHAHIHNMNNSRIEMDKNHFTNVMKAYSVYDREVGYCQVSAFIVGLLLMQMPGPQAFTIFIKQCKSIS